MAFLISSIFLSLALASNGFFARADTLGALEEAAAAEAPSTFLLALYGCLSCSDAFSAEMAGLFGA